MLCWGPGVISVPPMWRPADARMCIAAFEGDFAGARAVNSKLSRLHMDLFVEANPIPVKWAVAQMGLIRADLRLPLTPLSGQYHQTVVEAMSRAGIAVSV